MALPVSPGPKSRDVAVRGWAGLTVRIAWTLLAQGVKVRGDVLQDARVHTLLDLERSTPLPYAEDIAAHRTRAFIRRARGLRPDDPWPQDAAMPLSPRWVRALERSTDAIGAAVFRKHYGDNRSLRRLEATLGVDRTQLEAARGGLREVVRRIGLSDGLPFDDWPVERLDRLLVRLASYAPGPCPPVVDVAEGAHREHVRNCPRCDRMVRMVRSGILTVDDLLPPTLGARPQSTATVLALQLHPDARAHRAILCAELQAKGYPLGDDLLLFDGDDLDEVSKVVRMAAEVERPHRSLIRGAWLEGPGAWCAHGLLGPLTEHLDRAVQHRSWGTVDRVGDLPAPLPPAPSSRSMLAAVATLTAVGLVLLRLAWSATASATTDIDLTASFTDSAQGLWVRFDAPEPHAVAVVAHDDDGLLVLSDGHDAASKAALAVGDGSYRAHTEGHGLLLVHRTLPVDLDDRLLDEASAADEPLDALRLALQQRYPDAVVHWRTR